MGGKAFSQAVAPGKPTLKVVRLSPTVYDALKKRCIKDLKELYPNSRVGALTEAPEKKDYGDIDLYFATAGDHDPLTMAVQLSAAGFIVDKSNSKYSMAVLVNGEPSLSTVRYTHVDKGGAKASTCETEETYAQVDIDVVPMDRLDYFLFHSSYSDMGVMLGHILRPLGFKLNHEGLHLRLRELDEPIDQNYMAPAAVNGLVLLSSDSAQIMRFLDLDVEAYNAGFKTLFELYAWLLKCNMLHLDLPPPTSTKSSERSRKDMRPVAQGFFSGFAAEHLPKKSKPTPSTNAPGADTISASELEAAAAQHEMLLQKAIKFFDKQTEYDQKHEPFARAARNRNAAILLKKLIAKACATSEGSESVRKTIRAFRRNVAVDESGDMSVSGTAHDDVDAQLFRLLDDGGKAFKDAAKTEAWMVENWEKVRSPEKVSPVEEVVVAA